jgi:hypothetical protein
MTDRKIEKVARVYYEAFEWSGCNGSRWDKLTDEYKQQVLRKADDWLCSVASAGFSIVPTRELQNVASAAFSLDYDRIWLVNRQEGNQ